MKPEASVATNEETQVLHRWSARRVQPVVLLYVAAVFLGMMALAHFVVHSIAAVKALALTAVGAIVPLVPAVLSRVEYRLTGTGLESRQPRAKAASGFKGVFTMAELSHVVPTSHGFKYFKKLDESSGVRRFWKVHVSDACSGEVHVESADRELVLEILDRYGIRRR